MSSLIRAVKEMARQRRSMSDEYLSIEAAKAILIAAGLPTQIEHYEDGEDGESTEHYLFDQFLPRALGPHECRVVIKSCQIISITVDIMRDVRVIEGNAATDEYRSVTFHDGEGHKINSMDVGETMAELLVMNDLRTTLNRIRFIVDDHEMTDANKAPGVTEHFICVYVAPPGKTFQEWVNENQAQLQS